MHYQFILDINCYQWLNESGLCNYILASLRIMCSCICFNTITFCWYFLFICYMDQVCRNSIKYQVSRYQGVVILGGVLLYAFLVMQW